MLKIGNIELKTNVGLSPMAGFSDSPYRLICRLMGAPFSYTEFVSADDIIHHSKKTKNLFRFKNQERPIWFQIFGNNKETLVEATKIIEQLEPDVIDLNMGCSTHKVSQRGSGAGLLKNPMYAGAIIEGMRSATNIPITAKIRLGWDKLSINYREVVHALEESGVEMISVHGRTKDMGYSGKADWEAIAEIKSFARVPIFGNGDIENYEQGLKRIQETGVDGVLVGRAGIGNPWLFGGIDKFSLGYLDIKNMILNHLNSMIEFYGEQFGLLLFRKHLIKYFKGFRNTDDIKDKLIIISDINKVINIMNEYEAVNWGASKSNPE